jgi:hypothetical protein
LTLQLFNSKISVEKSCNATGQGKWRWRETKRSLELHCVCACALAGACVRACVSRVYYRVNIVILFRKTMTKMELKKVAREKASEFGPLIRYY